MKTCKKHPKYKAVTLPRCNCDDCWKIFQEKYKVKLPIDANTKNQVYALPRTYFESKNTWILIDNDEINLVNQKIGKSPTSDITIKKEDFDKLVRWYVLGKE